MVMASAFFRLALIRPFPISRTSSCRLNFDKVLQAAYCPIASQEEANKMSDLSAASSAIAGAARLTPRCPCNCSKMIWKHSELPRANVTGRFSRSRLEARIDKARETEEIMKDNLATSLVVALGVGL
jgi:hypothetical protein